MFSPVEVLIVKMKKPPSLAVFRDFGLSRFVSLLLTLLRYLTAFPPPPGWNS